MSPEWYVQQLPSEKGTDTKEEPGEFPPKQSMTHHRNTDRKGRENNP